MSFELDRHIRRLRWLHGAAGGLVVASVAVPNLLPPSPVPPFTQTEAVLGVLVALAVVNLLTLRPGCEAMTASARRVFAVSAESAPLLRAHLLAQAIAAVRSVTLAAFALAALYAAGRTQWFWVLEATAVLATLLVWPRRRQVEALLGLPSNSRHPAR